MQRAGPARRGGWQPRLSRRCSARTPGPCPVRGWSRQRHVCAEAPGTPANRPVHPDRGPETLLIQPHTGHSKPRASLALGPFFLFWTPGGSCTCVSPGLRTLVAPLWDLLSG